MVRSRFDSQLEQLNVELIRMGALCEEAITASVSALIRDDKSVVQTVFEKDNEIDKMEREIETFCMRLLLQQQPVAKDLRAISSALKMISDMERIGDQAGDIAEIMAHLCDHNTQSKLALGGTCGRGGASGRQRLGGQSGEEVCRGHTRHTALEPR